MAAMTLDSLPVGFRFRPTDEEVVNHYLLPKINGDKSVDEVIGKIALCQSEPWDLPDLSVIKNDEEQWFFFCFHDLKYPNSRRPCLKRSTQAGYWKGTGPSRDILSRSSDRKIGTKKTLVFIDKEHSPKGKNTPWVIHEYETISEQRTFVLCRLFNKDVKVEDSNSGETELSGPTPTGGASSENRRKKRKMLQATSETVMQVGEQSAGIERCLADKSDDITFDTQAPEEDHTYMASDVEEREAEARAAEDDTPFEDLFDSFFVPTNGDLYSNLDEIYSNLGEIEPIGSTLTAAGSSPQGMPSAQSTSESDMQVGEQSAGIERCLADKSDDITFDTQAPEEDHTYTASDVEEREAEARATEDDTSIIDLLRPFYVPTEGELFSNLDQIEPIGSTLTAAGSSSKGIASNQAMAQSTSESDMQIGDQPDHRNTCMASDGEDREAEVRATERDSLPSSTINELTVGPLYSPLRLEMFTGPGSSYMVSPFAGDPGLESGRVVHNNQEYSCDESTSQNNRVAEGGFCWESDTDDTVLPSLAPCQAAGEAQSYSFPDFEKNKEISQEPIVFASHQCSKGNEGNSEAIDEIVGLRSRPMWNAKQTVNWAAGEATEHTQSPDISDFSAKNLNQQASTKRIKLMLRGGTSLLKREALAAEEGSGPRLAKYPAILRDGKSRGMNLGHSFSSQDFEKDKEISRETDKKLRWRSRSRYDGVMSSDIQVGHGRSFGWMENHRHLHLMSNNMNLSSPFNSSIEYNHMDGEMPPSTSYITQHES